MTPSLARQAFALRGCFPNSEVVLDRRRLTWRGSIQPTAASRQYLVEIVYELGWYPAVRIVEPALDCWKGESTPHIYDNGCLCLHLPGEWRSGMLIARSTVAWTSEWLLNYEIWLGTGIWYGGGEWPPRRPLDTPRRAERRAPAPSGRRTT